jgi:hypothetical protein
MAKEKYFDFSSIMHELVRILKSEEKLSLPRKG